MKIIILLILLTGIIFGQTRKYQKYEISADTLEWGIPYKISADSLKWGIPIDSVSKIRLINSAKFAFHDNIYIYPHIYYFPKDDSSFIIIVGKDTVYQHGRKMK